MATTSGERRAHERLPIEMWVDQEQGDVTYFQRSANLSSGGIYFPGTLPEPIGTRVKLRFTLPGDDDPISVAAEVVGGDAGPERPGMRLRFVDLEQSVSDRIDAAIEREATRA